MPKAKSYQKHLVNQLRDPQEAAKYLNAALHDPDPHVFLLALRDLAEAQGGMTQLAERTSLNRENLYRTLSLRGNPRFFNLLAVLDAFDVEISLHPRERKKRKKCA